jgi:hypothetical protein
MVGDHGTQIGALDAGLARFHHGKQIAAGVGTGFVCGVHVVCAGIEAGGLGGIAGNDSHLAEVRCGQPVGGGRRQGVDADIASHGSEIFEGRAGGKGRRASQYQADRKRKILEHHKEFLLVLSKGCTDTDRIGSDSKPTNRKSNPKTAHLQPWRKPAPTINPFRTWGILLVGHDRLVAFGSKNLDTCV